MLDKKHTTLDNDFITVWSYYLLTGKLSGKREFLKQLAKMGQIDAIQAWYQFNDIGTCPEIDSKLKEIAKENKSFEVLAAVSNFEHCDLHQQELFKALIRRMATTMREYHETCQINKEQFEEDVRNIKWEMGNIPFIKHHETATKIALKQAQETGDVYTRERANELLLEQLPFCLTEQQRKNLGEKVTKDNKTVLTDLWCEIQDNLTKNRYWTAKDNPGLAFAFAKAVKMFNNPNNSSRLDNIATKILGTLSQRELSAELYDALDDENSNF